MNKIKIISLILAVLLMFSVVGCKEPDNGDEDITATATNIVENGVSDYKIIYSTTAGDYVKTAASEIQHFISLSTGCVLQVVTDENVTITENSKYISLGQNKVTEYYNFNVLESEVGTRGYRIKTKDNTVMISGAAAQGFGTLYGAYEFLEHSINYFCYDPWYGIRYDKKSKVELLDFDLMDKPDIEYIMYPSGRVEFETTEARRMKMEGYEDMLMTDYGTVHNDFEYLPPNEYKEAHPLWYNSKENPKQLCYTAHGDETEYQLMIDTIAGKMIEMLDKYPEKVNMALTEMDEQIWCDCNACSESNKKYGGNSAVCVKLCNAIAEKIENHYKALEQEREFYILFFVYMKTEDAPVKEENGKYVGIDKSVYCNKHVIPFIATMYTQNRIADYNSDKNRTSRTLIEKWNALSEKMAIWTYCVSFENYLIPYNAMTCISTNVKFFKEMGTVMYMNNTAYVANATAFESVRRYLNAQLSWDTEADVNDLLDRYFKNYYAEAGDVMQKFYNDWSVRYMYNFEEFRLSGKDDTMPTSDMYPYPVLKQWMGYLDQATKIINENYVGEEARDYLNAIDTERVSIYYLMINLHSEKYKPTDLLNLKKEFKQICSRVEIQHIKLDIPLDNLFAEWGI